MKTKNIFIELSEVQKIDIQLIAARCSVRTLRTINNTNTPDPILSAVELMSDALESELSTLHFHYMKQLADKDAIIERLLKQIK